MGVRDWLADQWKKGAGWTADQWEKRAGWVCPKCGHFNVPSATECSICKEPNPPLGKGARTFVGKGVPPPGARITFKVATGPATRVGVVGGGTVGRAVKAVSKAVAPGPIIGVLGKLPSIPTELKSRVYLLIILGAGIIISFSLGWQWLGLALIFYIGYMFLGEEQEMVGEAVKIRDLDVQVAGVVAELNEAQRQSAKTKSQYWQDRVRDLASELTRLNGELIKLKKKRKW